MWILSVKTQTELVRATELQRDPTNEAQTVKSLAGYRLHGESTTRGIAHHCVGNIHTTTKQQGCSQPGDKEGPRCAEGCSKANPCKSLSRPVRIPL